jgi:hypothetical protein
MLAFAGADELAEAARRDASAVVSATDKVVELLEQARAQSHRNRGTVPA